MAVSRVAYRYIKSLLGLAVEQGALDAVHKDMQLFASVCNQNREFELMLKNPIVRHDKKKEILHKLFEGKVHKLSMAIFDMMTRKNREALLPSIAKEFHTAYNIYNGIGKAAVTTAVPLDENLRSQLKGIARQLSAQNDVELEERIDEEMIGGFILNVDDKQIDASIKSKLNALKIKLSKNPYVKEF